MFLSIIIIKDHDWFVLKGSEVEVALWKLWSVVQFHIFTSVSCVILHYVTSLLVKCMCFLFSLRLFWSLCITKLRFRHTRWLFGLSLCIRKLPFCHTKWLFTFFKEGVSLDTKLTPNRWICFGIWNEVVS